MHFINACAQKKYAEVKCLNCDKLIFCLLVFFFRKMVKEKKKTNTQQIVKTIGYF